jgi:antitoxin (DNA-binding transcriptional repressor) of toxin-antitoxin stability system
MLTITIDEIQKNLTSYLHQVAAGESIIIIEAGKAIAEIKPVPDVMETIFLLAK